MNWSEKAYVRFLLMVGGLGGLLYGIDCGVIAVSMPYIKALHIYTDAEVSRIVGGVLFGGILASATAGILCNRFGRRTMITTSALLFLVAIPIICLSGTSIVVMMIGRVLQGMSTGYMAVAMPMYLVECLPADRRGRGTGIFQLFLGIGMVTAAAVGILISVIFGAADASAAVVPDTTKAVAWRVNFLWTLAPVSVLFICSMMLKESPVWLKMRNEKSAASHLGTQVAVAKGSLFQRRYVLPFVLTVLVLTFNKTIGINTIFSYAVALFQKAGLSGTLGNVGDMALKGTNLVITLLAVGLVDKKGRTWLLKIGTAGLTVGLFMIGAIFLALEHGWLPPSRLSGFITLAAFLTMQAFYSLGPGICVWLVLSELMPTRIRANGMAIALFANQFVAWGLSSSFFPLVDAWGYGLVFFGFAATGVLYFVTVLFIPETKGKSLDELDHLFDKNEK